MHRHHNHINDNTKHQITVLNSPFARCRHRLSRPTSMLWCKYCGAASTKSCWINRWCVWTKSQVTTDMQTHTITSTSTTSLWNIVDRLTGWLAGQSLSMEAKKRNMIRTRVRLKTGVKMNWFAFYVIITVMKIQFKMFHLHRLPFLRHTDNLSLAPHEFLLRAH